MGETTTLAPNMHEKEESVVDPRLACAHHFHQSGKIEQAESLYREILQENSEDPSALHGLGLVAYQSGAFDAAVSLFTQAVAGRLDYIQALNNLGNALSAVERYVEALPRYNHVLELVPDHIGALANRANCLRSLGRRTDALQDFEAVLAVDPDYHLARMNYGKTLLELGRFTDSISEFDIAGIQHPEDTDVHFHKGLALSLDEEFDGAIDAFDQCLRLDPKNTEALFKRGYAETHCDRRDAAQISYRLALELDPDHTAAHNNLGNLLASLGQYDEAATQYELALKRVPHRVDIIDNLGLALRKAGRFDEAFETFDRALKLNPNFGSALNNLGAAYQCIGDIENAADYYLRALKVEPDENSAEKNYLFALLNLPGISSEELYARHRKLRRRHTRTDLASKSFPERARDTNRRLKIGYLSSDFRTHVISLNLLPLISEHDHETCEIYLYAEVEHADQLTDMFKDHADHWRPTVDMSDAEVACMIEGDNIDILVCMAGRFDQNRPLVAAHRPAPIQVSFHDCATSGLDDMDYWLSDSYLHPENSPEQFSEELYRLPVFYQYPAPEGIPDIGPLPAIRNGHVTFASFNKPEKVNDEVVALWSEVLKAVPESQLLLKYFNLYQEPKLQERWLARFAEHGITAERLILRAKNDARNTHLEIYNEVDIALDPFPFNGATTTFEALSMGAPVITLLGNHFVDRVAASILHHSGHGDLVADSPSAYVEIARGLATDLPRLSSIRSRLRPDLAASPICDAPTYARNVEAAYRDIWRRWCRTHHGLHQAAE